jgi:hypothetical protein
MYKVTKETENGTQTDYLQDWKDILGEGFVVGLWFSVVGITCLLATPFVTIYTAYRQWKDGGIRCGHEERNRKVFNDTREAESENRIDGIIPVVRNSGDGNQVK